MSIFMSIHSKKVNCCASDEKINFNAKENHSEDDGHNHEDEDEKQSAFKKYLPATISFVLLVSGIIFEQTKRVIRSNEQKVTGAIHPFVESAIFIAGVNYRFNAAFLC